MKKTDGKPFESREVFIETGTRVQTDIFRRESLALGQMVSGPAVIEQLDTTTYIAPDWVGKQERDGTLWIRRAER
jgi:N-methylhydantoinase A